MKKRSVILLASVSLFSLETGFAQAANELAGSAAKSTPTQAGNVDSGVIEDIVVTALRREERLMDVPGSIVAINGEALVNSGIREIGALSQTVPGFFSDAGLGYSQVFIRGIGNNVQLGADASVATYIDDVPRLYGSLVDSFMNVDHIEVLKGAQGGLYGRNATGGVVAITTKQPTDDLSGQVRASYGEHASKRVAGYFNAPLVKGIAWNLSVQREVSDGLIKNLANDPAPYKASMIPDNGTPGSLGGINVNPYGTGAAAAAHLNSGVNLPGDLANRDFWAVDSKLRGEFGNFKLTLAGDYSKKNDSSGNAWYTSDPTVLRSFLVNRLLPAYAGIYQTCAAPGGKCGSVSLPAFPVAGKFETYAPLPSKANLEDYGFSGTAKLTLDNVALTSITAYRAQQQLYAGDTISIYPTLAPALNIKKSYFYQELRAVSTGSGPLSYIFGATYLRAKYNGNSNAVVLGLLNTPPTIGHTVTKNWSAYAEIGYDLTNNINLTASGRYLHENEDADFSTPVSAASVSASKFLPSATLSYKLDGGGNLFARYAKGFKAGGVNVVNPPTSFTTDFGKLFGPEGVNSYEAGFKVALLDRAMQLTGSVFYNDFSGVQTSTTGNASHPLINFAVINAGSARTYGAESTMTWRVTQPVTLDASLGYLNAKYKDFRNADASVLNVFDFSHQTMLFSPEWQLSLGGNLDQSLNNAFRLVGNVRASYLSEVRLTASPIPTLPDVEQGAYWLVNARLGLKSADDKWEVSVFADNLFNQGYATHGSTGSTGNKFIWGKPRIAGVEVIANF